MTSLGLGIIVSPLKDCLGRLKPEKPLAEKSTQYKIAPLLLERAHSIGHYNCIKRRDLLIYLILHMKKLRHRIEEVTQLGSQPGEQPPVWPS